MWKGSTGDQLDAEVRVPVGLEGANRLLPLQCDRRDQGVMAERFAAVRVARREQETGPLGGLG